jgi:hypothetical protein
MTSYFLHGQRLRYCERRRDAMLTKRLGTTLLALAVAGTGVVAWNYQDDVAATPAASASLRVIASPSAAQVLASDKHAAIPSLPVEAALSEQVERLLATHDPEKVMAAYSLLSNCDQFNRFHDRVVFDEELRKKNAHSDDLSGYRGMTESEKQHDKVLCGPMTERMHQSRIDYLAIAAKAGVSGAAVAFEIEGPFGDRSALSSRPDGRNSRNLCSSASSPGSTSSSTNRDSCRAAPFSERWRISVNAGPGCPSI